MLTLLLSGFLIRYVLNFSHPLDKLSFIMWSKLNFEIEQHDFTSHLFSVCNTLYCCNTTNTWALWVTFDFMPLLFSGHGFNSQVIWIGHLKSSPFSILLYYIWDLKIIGYCKWVELHLVLPYQRSKDIWNAFERSVRMCKYLLMFANLYFCKLYFLS